MVSVCWNGCRIHYRWIRNRSRSTWTGVYRTGSGVSSWGRVRHDDSVPGSNGQKHPKNVTPGREWRRCALLESLSASFARARARTYTHIYTQTLIKNTHVWSTACTLQTKLALQKIQKYYNSIKLVNILENPFGSSGVVWPNKHLCAYYCKQTLQLTQKPLIWIYMKEHMKRK